MKASELIKEPWKSKKCKDCDKFRQGMGLSLCLNDLAEKYHLEKGSTRYSHHNGVFSRDCFKVRKSQKACPHFIE